MKTATAIIFMLLLQVFIYPTYPNHGSPDYSRPAQVGAGDWVYWSKDHTMNPDYARPVYIPPPQVESYPDRNGEMVDQWLHDAEMGGIR